VSNPRHTSSIQRAIIVGSNGQDGSLITNLLVKKGYEVFGITRDNCNIHDCDDVLAAVRQHDPAQIYYLAAYHESAERAVRSPQGDHIRLSFETNTLAVLSFLEAIRLQNPSCRLFFAASAHIFGSPSSNDQNEETPVSPTCTYGISKAAGYHLCKYYREKHGLYAATGILYNHACFGREKTFVIPKIVHAAVAAKKAESCSPLVLGDLSAMVDWGYAPDYAEAMVKILDLPEASDFIVATGELHSVLEVVQIAFGTLGLNWRDHVTEHPNVITKAQRKLCGDSARLRRATGWQPTVTFQEMIQLLVQKEYEKA
jgi:GDPmannose 4,6-dehydratase